MRRGVHGKSPRHKGDKTNYLEKNEIERSFEDVSKVLGYIYKGEDTSERIGKTCMSIQLSRRY